jgi:hypothetical protein
MLLVRAQIPDPIETIDLEARVAELERKSAPYEDSADQVGNAPECDAEGKLGREQGKRTGNWGRYDGFGSGSGRQERTILDASGA